MFDTIILRADGSANAQRAGVVARELVGKMGSRVIVVHGFPHVPRTLIGDQEYETIPEWAAEQGTETAERPAEPLRSAGIDVETDVLEGPASQTILRVAQVRKADLIVIGSRGLGDWQAMVLGSVSHKVVHHAPCPVLIVH